MYPDRHLFKWFLKTPVKQVLQLPQGLKVHVIHTGQLRPFIFALSFCVSVYLAYISEDFM